MLWLRTGWQTQHCSLFSLHVPETPCSYPQAQSHLTVQGSPRLLAESSAGQHGRTWQIAPQRTTQRLHQHLKLMITSGTPTTIVWFIFLLGSKILSAYLRGFISTVGSGKQGPCRIWPLQKQVPTLNPQAVQATPKQCLWHRTHRHPHCTPQLEQEKGIRKSCTEV